MFYVDYDPVFEGYALPRHLFPLPVPSMPHGRLPKAFDKVVAFAERYSTLSVEEIASTRVPKALRYRSFRTRNQVLDSLLVSVATSVDFYSRWMMVSKEEDTPDMFPKGVSVLVKGTRSDLERDVRLLRSGDYREFVVAKYTDAYRRCAAFCDAARRGHLADPGSKMEFSVAHVQKTMHRNDGFVGIVDDHHIKLGLLREATDASPMEQGCTTTL